MNDQNDIAVSSPHHQTPESDLHILGALVAGNLASDAVSADQWPTITGLSLQHGLAPMLHWTLKQAGVEIESNPTWHPLVHARYQTAIDWALKERAQLEIDAALRAAGIPAIWLKGSVLARTVYPEPSLRPMGDLDVLVPYEQRESALGVLQGEGYDFYTLQAGKRPVSTGDALLQKSTPHHYALQGGVANSVHLELHFRLLGEDDVLPLSQLQRIVANQQQINLADGNSLCALTAEAHLIYLAAHAILQHGEGNPHLLRYFDVHRLITQISPAWDKALDLAVDLQWTYVLERALRNAVEYFSTPVPPEVFDALISRRPATEDPASVARFQGRWHEWELFRRKLARVSLREKFRMIFRELCPTPAYMRHFYGIKAERPVWPYYVYRWLNRSYKVVRLVGERLASWVRLQMASIHKRKA